MNTVHLTDDELQTTIESLLFGTSINIVSNTDPNYQQKMFDVAVKLREHKQDIKLDNISFIKEEDYEEKITQTILDVFEQNLKFTSFEHV